MIEVVALLGVAALIAFGVRKRLAVVGTVTIAALAAAIAIVVLIPMDASGDVLELPWHMSELARLEAVVSAADPVPIAAASFRALAGSATKASGVFALFEERAGVWLALMLIATLLVWAVR